MGNHETKLEETKTPLLTHVDVDTAKDILRQCADEFISLVGEGQFEQTLEGYVKYLKENFS